MSLRHGRSVHAEKVRSSRRFREGGFKAELAAERTGGIMVWEMTQDTDDQLLGRTIAAALRPAAAN